jgi:hypothetical protein
VKQQTFGFLNVEEIGSCVTSILSGKDTVLKKVAGLISAAALMAHTVLSFTR